MIAALRDTLRILMCLAGCHDPAWKQTIVFSGMDMARNYAVSQRHCALTCRHCPARVGPVISVHTWEPVELMGIPNLCPDCKLVHGTKVCP